MITISKKRLSEIIREEYRKTILESSGWESVRQSVVDRHGLENLSGIYNEEFNNLEILLIRVDKESRREGNASSAMKEILSWADSVGASVTLSPSSDFGSSKAMLTRWYKGLGFKSNAGRKRDHRLMGSMIRMPST